MAGIEPLVIRPPTEAHSVLIRVTRGCNWDRCRFCGIYGAFGQKAFEIRPVADVLADIDRARAVYPPPHETAFFGDADPIVVDPRSFIVVARRLYEVFPEMRRLTCYARAQTCWMRRADLPALAAAGLSRLHVGLESGDDELLRYHRKGASARIMTASGRAVKDAGMELSHYVLLGMGGADRQRQHTENTVAVLNAVQPDFVRFRRLWAFGGDGGPACPLWKDIQDGSFCPQTPEGTVVELRDMIAGIEFPTEIEAIHHNVYVTVQGRLPGSRGRMLAKIDAFLALPDAERQARYAQRSVI